LALDSQGSYLLPFQEAPVHDGGPFVVLEKYLQVEG
jgi:hypothetical protein